MNYAIFILRRAQKELAGLPAEAYEQTKAAILELGQERAKTEWMSEINRTGGLAYPGRRL